MKPTHFVVTASRTADGSVVYLTADRAWTTDLARAATCEAADVEPHLDWARAQQAAVCDPYRLGVALDTGAPTALTARERIRAAGPQATLAALGLGDL
jgi:hypothetical protein